MFGSSKADRAEKKAAKKAQKQADKAGKKVRNAADKAALARTATGPARLVDSLTNPKTAKRALAAAKIVVPVLAPFALKAVVSTRGFLDEQRAHRLGVTAAEVAAFRGPTGATGARISGLSRSIDELVDRKGSELQITRFAEVSRSRLKDLTTAVQASASMPRVGRRKVLRAVNRELDQVSADLMTYLVGAAA